MSALTSLNRVGVWIVAALLTAGLGACGFKLRGVVDVPPELAPIYVQASPGSPVGEAMMRSLAVSGVPLAASSADARLIVRILGESRSSRVAAVDRDGKVIASELHYRVVFDAVAPDGTALRSSETLDLVRTYENPDVEVLGKQQEAELIYEDLVEDAADRILMRLRVALR